MTDIVPVAVTVCMESVSASQAENITQMTDIVPVAVTVCMESVSAPEAENITQMTDRYCNRC